MLSNLWRGLLFLRRWEKPRCQPAFINRIIFRTCFLMNITNSPRKIKENSYDNYYRMGFGFSLSTPLVMSHTNCHEIHSFVLKTCLPVGVKWLYWFWNLYTSTTRQSFIWTFMRKLRNIHFDTYLYKISKNRRFTKWYSTKLNIYE
jgi:hypothetical protein